MREPLTALQRADAVAAGRPRRRAAAVDPPLASRCRAYRCSSTRCAGRVARAAAGVERPIGQLVTPRVVAVAGMAQPDGVLRAVRHWEAQIGRDLRVSRSPSLHARRLAADRRAPAHDADLIVTTEKDLVKLEAFPFAKGKLVALRIAPQVDDGDALVRWCRTHRSDATGLRSTQEETEWPSARSCSIFWPARSAKATCISPQRRTAWCATPASCCIRSRTISRSCSSTRRSGRVVRSPCPAPVSAVVPEIPRLPCSATRGRRYARGRLRSPGALR